MAYPHLPDASLEQVEDVHVELRRIDLIVSIGNTEIGEGARLAETLGIVCAAELNASAFSSEDLIVGLGRTADGKAKATVTPNGAPPAFFLRVKAR